MDSLLLRSFKIFFRTFLDHFFVWNSKYYGGWLPGTGAESEKTAPSDAGRSLPGGAGQRNLLRPFCLSKFDMEPRCRFLSNTRTGERSSRKNTFPTNPSEDSVRLSSQRLPCYLLLNLICKQVSYMMAYNPDSFEHAMKRNEHNPATQKHAFGTLFGK